MTVPLNTCWNYCARFRQSGLSSASVWYNSGSTREEALTAHLSKRGSLRVVIFVLCLLTGLGNAKDEAFAQPRGGWEQKVFENPSPRYDHDAAYDSARHVTVLFGGEYVDSIWRRLAETWEWNGGSWTLVATDGPLKDEGHAMAYHASMQAVLLHGTSWNGTWSWNGVQWQSVNASGPLRRSGFSLSYDSTRDRTILFGGYSLYDDTWEFDGVNWRPLPGGSPTQRAGMSMAFDGDRGVAVMFGGGFDLITSDETWEWDGEQWSLVAIGGTPLREHYGIAYDSDRNVALMFGGEEDDEWLNLKPPDTWAWNGVRPGARRDHTLRRTKTRRIQRRHLAVGWRAVDPPRDFRSRAPRRPCHGVRHRT